MDNNKNNTNSPEPSSPSQDKNHDKDTSHQKNTTNPTHHSPPSDESPTLSHDTERTPKKTNRTKLILIVISLILIAGIAGGAAFFAMQQNESESVVENALENLLQQKNISEYEIAIEATNSDPLQSITYNGKDNSETNQHQGLLTIATQQGSMQIDTFATPDTFYIRIPKTALDTLLATALTSTGGTGIDTTPIQALLQPRIAPIADQWIRVDLKTLNVDELILLMQTIFPEIRTTLTDLLGEETMPEEEWNRLEQDFTTAVETTIIPELTRFQQQWQQQNRVAEDIQPDILSIVKDTYSQYDIIRSAKEKETKTIDQRNITTYEIEIDQEQTTLFTQSVLKSIVETIQNESIPFGVANTQLTAPLSEEPMIEGEYTLTIGIDKEQQLPYLMALHIQPRSDIDETVTMTLKINAFNTNPVLAEPTDTETWVRVLKDSIVLFLMIGLQGL